MKSLKFTLIIPLLLFAISCKKSSTNATATTNISTDEAIDMAVSSMASNSFGFASVTDNISANAQGLTSVGSGQTVNSTGTNAVLKQPCGTTLADSISFNGNANSITFSAFYKYTRTLNCNTNSQPDNLTNAITFRGNFDGPRLTSNDSGTASVSIAGLVQGTAGYVVNGVYNRKGAFTSKVGNKASGSSNVTITATNVLLNKQTGAIISGSAVITVSGSVPAGAFNFTGTIVFNGSGQATVTIGASVYLVNLVTGAYTKK